MYNNFFIVFEQNIRHFKISFIFEIQIIKIFKLGNSYQEIISPLNLKKKQHFSNL